MTFNASSETFSKVALFSLPVSLQLLNCSPPTLTAFSTNNQPMRFFSRLAALTSEGTTCTMKNQARLFMTNAPTTPNIAISVFQITQQHTAAEKHQINNTKRTEYQHATKTVCCNCKQRWMTSFLLAMPNAITKPINEECTNLIYILRDSHNYMEMHGLTLLCHIKCQQR